MRIFLSFLITIFSSSLGLGQNWANHSFAERVDISTFNRNDVLLFEAVESGLCFYSDSGLFISFLAKGESQEFRVGGIKKFGSGIWVYPAVEKPADWRFRVVASELPGGKPIEMVPGKKVVKERPSIALILIFLFLVLAFIRVLNNYSYSFLIQPLTSFGRGQALEQFSSGLFPIIFLSVFIGFSVLLGYVIDLVIPGEFAIAYSGGGFLIGLIPTPGIFFLLALAFIIVRFLFYNFLSFLTGEKELGAILFSSALILGSILLIILTIIVSIVGFENFVYVHPRIVAFIFIIFAALFGIGMLLTHLNMGTKIPISVRFFGIVAMEILPTVFIVKVLIEG